MLNCCLALPNDKILDWPKLKASADNNIHHVTEKLKFVFRKVENIVGKGETAGFQHFLRFPQCFQNNRISRLLKDVIVLERVNRLLYCRVSIIFRKQAFEYIEYIFLK